MSMLRLDGGVTLSEDKTNVHALIGWWCDVIRGQG